jgi:CubicO group peptidase (beta-lactamase class C family)
MTWHRCAAIALLFSGVPIAAGWSGRKDSGDVERRVDQVFGAYDKSGSPGCALGVIRDGNFVYKRGYGLASLELGVPLTPESVFYMGSVSKQFTAASVVLAAEQGYLSLDDDVHKYVAELPNYGRPITLREMLHHTSGLRDIFTLLTLAGQNAEDIHPTAELLDVVARQKSLNFAPGDEYSYSNTNFFLMSVVIRRATGKPLSQFADENIFQPLGMTHTRFYDDHTAVVAGRVPAYAPRPVTGFRVDWSTNFDKVGDGGLLSSVEDLLLWDRNFYDNKLGKGTLLKELQTRGVLNNGKQIDYALGLVMSEYRGLPVVGHRGALFGYRTELLRFPQQKFSVICLCNVSSSEPSEKVNKVADAYLAGQLAREPAIAAAANVDAHPYAGWYRNRVSHSVIQLNVLDGDLELFGEKFKARDESHFATPFGSEMAFEHKQNGAVQMVLSSKDGAPETFETYEVVKPTAGELEQYAGEYENNELQAKYRCAVKDGKVTLAINWREPEVLEPTVRDEFKDSLGMTIVFRRDSSGRVSGYEVFAGRARNIRFTRTK